MANLQTPLAFPGLSSPPRFTPSILNEPHSEPFTWESLPPNRDPRRNNSLPSPPALPDFPTLPLLPSYIQESKTVDSENDASVPQPLDVNTDELINPVSFGFSLEHSLADNNTYRILVACHHYIRVLGNLPRG